jgi:hypothetical protein
VTAITTSYGLVTALSSTFSVSPGLNGWSMRTRPPCEASHETTLETFGGSSFEPTPVLYA